MTSTGEFTDDPTTEDRRGRRVRPAVWIAALVIALAASAGIGYWRWSVGATDLFSYGGINQTGPLRVGQVLYVGADIQPDAPSSGHRLMYLHRVSPQITLNSAQATVRVLVCVVADQHEGMGMGFDTKPCRRVTAFKRGSLDLGFPAAEIVYEIRATRPGAVRIEGAEVSYDVGSRSGVQHAGSGTALQVHA